MLSLKSNHVERGKDLKSKVQNPKVKGQRRKSLWRASVVTSVEAEEAVTELLNSFFDQPIASYHDLDARTITVSCFLDETCYAGNSWIAHTAQSPYDNSLGMGH